MQTDREQLAIIQLHNLTGRLVHQETVRLYNDSNERRLTELYQLSGPELYISRKLALY